MAAQHNLTIESGTDYETFVYIGVGDDSYTFNYKDYRATLRNAYGGTPQYSFTIKEDSANKKITVSLTEETTRQLTAGTWVWDLIENTTNIVSSVSNNLLTTVNGSAIVTCNWSNHGLTTDDEFTMSNISSQPGGYSAGDFNKTHTITAITNENKFTVTMSGNASAGATGGNGTFTARYKTQRLLEGDVLVTPYVTLRGDSAEST